MIKNRPRLKKTQKVECQKCGNKKPLYLLNRKFITGKAICDNCQ